MARWSIWALSSILSVTQRKQSRRPKYPLCARRWAAPGGSRDPEDRAAPTLNGRQGTAAEETPRALIPQALPKRHSFQSSTSQPTYILESPRKLL